MKINVQQLVTRPVQHLAQIPVVQHVAPHVPHVPDAALDVGRFVAQDVREDVLDVAKIVPVDVVLVAKPPVLVVVAHALEIVMIFVVQDVHILVALFVQ